MDVLILPIFLVLGFVIYMIYMGISSSSQNKINEPIISRKDRDFVNSLNDSDFVEFYENLSYRLFPEYFKLEGTFQQGYKDYLITRWSTDKYLIEIYGDVDGFRGFTTITRKSDNKRIR